MTRALTKHDSFTILKQIGIPVATVLDVGIQYGTPDLMQSFPSVPHLLFEPVEEYAAKIEEAYRDIPHKLYQVAVSDVTGQGHLQTLELTGGGVSHAMISNKGRPIETVRLDKVVPESGYPGPYLLKVDVEGAEIPGKILDGAAGIMKDVSIVVCEMVGTRFIDLGSRIERHGFVLWDIVESCYYDDIFWQCDAIFVRREDHAKIPALRPLSIASFDPKKWWATSELPPVAPRRGLKQRLAAVLKRVLPDR